MNVGEPEREYKATVVGRDADTDVAVLKIDATGLPTAALGDSDQLQVGDTVLAIGDPFQRGADRHPRHRQRAGADHESSISRTFEDFIQTDAPTASRQLGRRPLLDAEGRVVGINTAILSHSGGSNGVGFSIPINLVRLSRRAIGEHMARSARGFLGVDLQPLTPDLAAQFGTGTGALVAPYHFEAVTEAGEKPGRVRSAPSSSSPPANSARRTSCSQSTPLLRRPDAGDIVAGRLSLRGRHVIDLTAGVATAGRIAAAAGVELRERSTGQTAVELPALDVTGVQADALTKKATVGLKLAGGHIRVRREKDGSTTRCCSLAAAAAAAAGGRTKTRSLRWLRRRHRRTSPSVRWRSTAPLGVIAPVKAGPEDRRDRPGIPAAQSVP